jgi:hypothetical protein
MATRPTRTSQLTLTVAIAVAAMAMLGCGSHQPDCKSYRFNSTHWIDLRRADPSGQRQEGLALARCRRLIGLTDVQVVEMLGRPPVKFSANHWNYWIEPASKLSDSGALEVFLRRGRVFSASAY